MNDPTEPTPDAAGARWLRRRHASGVAVVTTLGEGELRGATLSAWFVASLQPFLILISVERESQLLEWIERTSTFVLNVVPRRDQFLADQFAGFTPRASPTFAGIDHYRADSGVPILSHSIAWAECSASQFLPVGDHVCVIGDVSQLGAGDGAEDDPLVYYLNRYRRFEQR